MNKVIITLLVFLPITLFGQNLTFKIDSILSERIMILKANEVGFTRKSCTGFGVNSSAYLFWKKDSDLMMQKLDLVEYPKQELKVYKPIKIKDDFFFPAFYERKNELEKEKKLKHFQISTSKKTTNESVSTGYIQTSHSCYRNLHIKSRVFELKKQFDYFDLSESLGHSENKKNINYKSNQGLKIIELDKLINNKIKEIEETRELKIINENENFKLFLANFSSNKKFQLSRVKFPLDDCKYIGQYAAPCNKIKKDEWKQLVLNDSTKYKVETSENPEDLWLEKYQRSLNKISSDGSNCLSYYFNLENNKWKLIQILRCSE